MTGRATAWLMVSIPFLFCLGLMGELLIDMKMT